MSDLKQKIIDESLRQLSETSIDQLSLRKITAALGVSHQSLYHHFGNRDSLLKALHELGYARLYERYVNALLEETTPQGQFKRVGVEYVLFAIDNPGLFKVMAHFNGYDEASAAKAKQCYKVLEHACQNVLRESQQALSLKHVTMMCWSSVHGYALLYANGLLRRSPEALREEIMELTGFFNELIL